MDIRWWGWEFEGFCDSVCFSIDCYVEAKGVIGISKNWYLKFDNFQWTVVCY